MSILGAGMSGCLAGVINPQYTIYEAQPEPPINHNAVLRFRSDAISKITGIPFEKVIVRKGIYYFNEFVEPNIELANLYSQKVTGVISNRSIWNIDTVERYVAPPDFQKQLFNLVAHRVKLNCKIDDLLLLDRPIISTIPMNAMCQILGQELPGDLHFQSIDTYRYAVRDCNVHQTIYYPSPIYKTYRATLTGDQLIIEMTERSLIEPDQAVKELDMVLDSFGITLQQISPIGDGYQKQKYGKIAPIDDNKRRAFLFNLTHRHGIYSAGRFAIWKNILMDDVLQDLYHIKEMQATDNYEHHRRK